MKKTTKYRKNKMKFALMVPLLMLLLGACFSPWAGETDETQLTIAFGTAGRVAVTEQELSGLNFEVILDGPGGKRTETFSGSTTATLRVLPGIYHIIIRGIGVTPPVYTGFPARMLRVWGSYEANVQLRQNNHANIAIATAVEVTSWSQLTTAVNLADINGRKTLIFFNNDFSSSGNISIGGNRDISFLAETPITINMLAPNNFTVANSGKLTLGENGMGGTLNFNGQNLNSTTPLITVNNGGVLVMNDGIVLENRRNSGNGGAINTSGTFTMNGGMISGNRATQGGGVFISSGQFILTSGTIYNNEASNGGGGVHISGILTMNGGAIMNNRATGSNAIGGGIQAGGGFLMNGGVIGGNTTSGQGGGYGIPPGVRVVFSKTSGIIYGNDAPDGLRNLARNNTSGHAAFASATQYRNRTAYENDNVGAAFWTNN